MGKLGDAIIFASETVALDIVGAEFIRSVEPGEIIVVRDGVSTSHKPFITMAPRPCIFEHVYFSRPDSIVDGNSVYSVRKAIGAELAKEIRIGHHPVALCWPHFYSARRWRPPFRGKIETQCQSAFGRRETDRVG
jgi:glutamine phosphoribosylpyrophosphate amidotransferase